MGFLFRLKKLFGQDKEYEQTYPNEVHKALKSVDDIFNESLSINEPHCSMEFIKNKEIEEPTHWIYKNVTDPIEMNYRDRSLRKSMIGHYDEVVKICMKGLEKYPNSPYLLYMLGRTLGDIGKASNDNQKYNEGISVLNHVIDLYPDFADAYVERGTIKIYLSSEDGAFRDFIQAREIEADIDLPIELDLKMFDIELKKRDIGRRFNELGIVNTDYSSGLPQETKTLSKKGVGIVLEYLPECKFDYVLYGSFPLMMSILPALKRIPGDIDIQLWTSKMEAEKFSRELFHLIKNAGEEVRLSPQNPIIIESRKTGRWERAVDIHHTEESPEDNLSPLYPLDSGTGEGGRREKRKLIIDFLDVFRMMKTCIELAKQNNIDMAKINEAESLIIEWKNLFSEFIDFERLEIKE